MSSNSDLKSIVKDLKENFETVKDIATTYQNDIYRQNPDDYDDLKEFIKNVEKNISDLNDVADLMEKAKKFKEEKRNREIQVKNDGYENGNSSVNYSVSYPSPTQNQSQGGPQKSYWNGYKKPQSSETGQGFYKNKHWNKNNDNKQRSKPWKQK